MKRKRLFAVILVAVLALATVFITACAKDDGGAKNNTFDGVTLTGRTVEYDGESHSLAVEGLPDGANVTYTNNGQTEPGTYNVTAELTRENYDPKTLTAELVIDKRELAITIDGETLIEYDGNAHKNEFSVKATNLVGNDEVEFVVSCSPSEEIKEVGTYTLTVNIFPHEHYKLTVPKTLTVEIVDKIYTAHLNAAGGTGLEKENWPITQGHPCDFPVLTREGYDFLGWYVGEEQLTDANGQSQKEWTYTDEDTTEVTAKWQVHVYHITYENLLGGTNPTGNRATYTIEEEPLALSDPTREHYDFKGWYSESGFENKVETIGDGTYKDYTLYAKWEPHPYNVTYELGGGNNDPENPSTYNIESDITLNAPTRTGYNFEGWHKDSVEGDRVEKLESATADLKLYAKWTPKNYQLTVNADNDDRGSVTGGGEVAYKSTATITATTNPGYTFIGWYNDGTRVSTDLEYEITMDTEGATYTAKWIKVTLEATAGGEVTVALTGTYKGGDNFTLGATSYLGYDFEGWYSGGENKYPAIDAQMTMPENEDAEDITYTATWKVKDEMNNFEFTSDETTCKITGIENKEVSIIVVPRYVTEISEGAFSGCGSLTSITLPFVGDKAHTPDEEYQYPFGYIFSASEPDDAEASKYAETSQYYYGEAADEDHVASNSYYIPNSLTTVIITGSTNIPRGAFFNCQKITSITLPEGLTDIGNSALAHCKLLTEIEIPSAVTTIGSSVFNDCGSLTQITVKPENTTFISADNGILYDHEKTKIVCVPANIAGDVTIPASVTAIGDYAFSYYKGTEITIPDGVTSIGGSAFSNCNATIKWGDAPTIATIGENAFKNYKGTEITIPDSVTSIAQGAFSGCGNLTSITLPFVGDKVYTAEDQDTKYPFGYIFGTSSYTGGTSTDQWYTSSSHTKYCIPNSLKTVTITGSTHLSRGAFFGCKNIASIILPQTLISIDESAFSTCTALTSITIPASVTSIGKNAFNKCSGTLKEVKFDAPENWQVSANADMSTPTDLQSADLSNQETAAKYLSVKNAEGGYSDYYWKRT